MNGFIKLVTFFFLKPMNIQARDLQSPVQTLPYEQYSLDEVETELPFALGLFQL